MLFFYGSVDKA